MSPDGDLERRSEATDDLERAAFAAATWNARPQAFADPGSNVANTKTAPPEGDAVSWPGRMAGLVRTTG